MDSSPKSPHVTERRKSVTDLVALFEAKTPSDRTLTPHKVDNSMEKGMVTIATPMTTRFAGADESLLRAVENCREDMRAAEKFAATELRRAAEVHES